MLPDTKPVIKMALNEVGKVYERPWGSYQTLSITAQAQTKIISVHPGGRLSLQSHEHRAEHWVVIAGLATVTIDGHVQQIAVGGHVFIAKKARHRLENLTQEPLQIIEVQVGDYLGEDDIVRYDDIYGRLH